MSKKRRLILNHPWDGRIKGSKVSVQCDDNGIPIEKIWRKRLRDAETDNNVTWAPEEKAKPEKVKPEPPLPKKTTKPKKTEDLAND